MSELLKMQIKTMDKTSQEFFEIYKLVNDKYWQFDDPDDDQNQPYTGPLKLKIKNISLASMILLMRLPISKRCCAKPLWLKVEKLSELFCVYVIIIVCSVIAGVFMGERFINEEAFKIVVMVSLGVIIAMIAKRNKS